jgi:hypothetical protein
MTFIRNRMYEFYVIRSPGSLLLLRILGKLSIPLKIALVHNNIQFSNGIGNHFHI